MGRRFRETWRQQALHLRREVHALALAYRDPGVPWYAKLFVACVVGYALSPIDLIPDPIPILGYLDDLVILPLGVALALRMIPPAVLAEAREKAQSAMTQKKHANWVAAGVIIALWIVAAAAAANLLMRLFRG